MKQNTSVLKRAGLIVTLLLAASFTVKAQEKITLQMAVDRMLANNLNIKQSQITEAIGNADLQQSRNNQLPNLSGNMQGGYNFGRSQIANQFAFSQAATFNANSSVNMGLTLFQGGQLRNQIIQNRLLVDVNKSNTAKLKNDLTLNVVTTYLQILVNQDLVTAANQQIDIANQTLQRSQISFDAGRQTLADLSQAKAQVATANLNLTNAQNQLNISMLVLKQYMEMNPYAEIVVEKPDISRLTNIRTLFDANEVVKTALGINPDIKLAEAQQRTFAQSIRIAKGSLYPTLSLSGGLSSGYSSRAQTSTSYATGELREIGVVRGTGQIVETPIFGSVNTMTPFGTQYKNNFAQSISLNLQIPIFNRFLVRTNIKKAELNFQNAQLSTQISKNNLSKVIMQAVLDLNAANKQFQSATQTFEANRDALNVTQQRYDVGLVNSLDYNTAVTNYNKSQNDMIQAQYSVIFRSKIIDYYLGNTITL
jgi:outer membrane protein